jgi:hypothetical protein
VKSGAEDRLRLVLSGILVGALLVVAIVIAIAYFPAQRLKAVTSTKWPYVIVTSGLIAGWVLHGYWQVRRSGKFWILLVTFLSLYVISAYVCLVPLRLGFLWLAPVAALEFGVFAFLVYRTLHVLPPHGR